MSNKTVLTIKRIYSCIMTVATVCLGFLFVLQVLRIYLAGTEPGYEGAIFSREIVSEKFAEISVAVVVWVVVAIAGIVLHILYPSSATKPALAPEYVLLRLKRRLPESCNAQELTVVTKQDKLIAVMKMIVVAVAVCLLACGVIYIFHPETLVGENVTGEIVTLVKIFFPLVGVVFALFIAISFYEKSVAKSQTAVVKALVGGNKTVTGKENLFERIFDNKIFLLSARIVIGVVGVVFVVVGMANGGMRDMLVKAVNICTECIGLG